MLFRSTSYVCSIRLTFNPFLRKYKTKSYGEFTTVLSTRITPSPGSASIVAASDAENRPTEAHDESTSHTEAKTSVRRSFICRSVFCCKATLFYSLRQRVAASAGRPKRAPATMQGRRMRADHFCERKSGPSHGPCAQLRQTGESSAGYCGFAFNFLNLKHLVLPEILKSST